MNRYIQPQQVHQLLEHEFERVGLRFSTSNIEIHVMPRDITQYRTRDSLGYGMNITFECLEDEFKYLQRIVTHVEQRHMPHFDEQLIRVDTYHMWDQAAKAAYEVYTVYRCTLTLRVTGDNIENFIQLFREELKPLYEAVESRRFDEEVERLLTEDEYNS